MLRKAIERKKNLTLENTMESCIICRYSVNVVNVTITPEYNYFHHHALVSTIDHIAKTDRECPPRPSVLSGTHPATRVHHMIHHRRSQP